MKIRDKFLIPIIGTIVFSGVIFFFGIIGTVNKINEKRQSSDLNTKIAEIQQAQKSIAQLALSHAALISEMPGVVEAYKIALRGNIDEPSDPTV